MLKHFVIWFMTALTLNVLYAKYSSIYKINDAKFSVVDFAGFNHALIQMVIETRYGLLS